MKLSYRFPRLCSFCRGTMHHVQGFFLLQGSNKSVQLQLIVVKNNNKLAAIKDYECVRRRHFEIHTF